MFCTNVTFCYFPFLSSPPQSRLKMLHFLCLCYATVFVLHLYSGYISAITRFPFIGHILCVLAGTMYTSHSGGSAEQNTVLWEAFQRLELPHTETERLIRAQLNKRAKWKLGKIAEGFSYPQWTVNDIHSLRGCQIEPLHLSSSSDFQSASLSALIHAIFTTPLAVPGPLWIRMIPYK